RVGGSIPSGRTNFRSIEQAVTSWVHGGCQAFEPQVLIQLLLRTGSREACVRVHQAAQSAPSSTPRPLHDPASERGGTTSSRLQGWRRKCPEGFDELGPERKPCGEDLSRRLILGDELLESPRAVGSDRV